MFVYSASQSAHTNHWCPDRWFRSCQANPAAGPGHSFPTLRNASVFFALSRDNYGLTLVPVAAQGVTSRDTWPYTRSSGSQLNSNVLSVTSRNQFEWYQGTTAAVTAEVELSLELVVRPCPALRHTVGSMKCMWGIVSSEPLKRGH